MRGEEFLYPADEPEVFITTLDITWRIRSF